jgi:hypothetical protein
LIGRGECTGSAVRHIADRRDGHFRTERDTSKPIIRIRLMVPRFAPASRAAGPRSCHTRPVPSHCHGPPRRRPDPINRRASR